MGMNKTIVIALFIILTIILAFTVLSQISLVDAPNPNQFSQTLTSQATDKISVVGDQDCTINFFNLSETIYGNVTHSRPLFVPCSDPINQSNSTCINSTEIYQSYEPIGKRIFLRNTTNCDTKSFVVSVQRDKDTEKKEVDFSSWGTCTVKS